LAVRPQAESVSSDEPAVEIARQRLRSAWRTAYCGIGSLVVRAGSADARLSRGDCCQSGGALARPRGSSAL